MQSGGVQSNNQLNINELFVINLNIKTIPNPPSIFHKCFNGLKLIKKLQYLIDLWTMFIAVKTTKQNSIIKQKYIFSILELFNGRRTYDYSNR